VGAPLNPMGFILWDAHRGDHTHGIP